MRAHTKPNQLSASLPRLIFILTAAAWMPANAAPITEDSEPGLEELMNVVVTSVAKKSQTLAQTAAAVHVISADDIRRSGATNIPEALRLAPGVQVSAIGHNKWAVSIRGFADRFSNKLLVMVDGRSVYTPLFSGVMWENLDVPLETIARIEVIRGPGAAVWGSNAVNGVINIITRSPFESQGGQLAVAAGNEQKGQAYLRYGWTPSPDTAVSLHAKLHDVDAAQRIGGGAGVDDWQQGSAGFKLEHSLADGRVLLQGGVARSRAGDELIMFSAPPAATLVQKRQDTSSGHLMGRWESRSASGRMDSLQFYLEQSDYEQVYIEEKRTTADIEYQQRLQLDERQELVWGLGYRYSTDRLTGSPMFTLAEDKRATSLYSLFAQNEITLQPDRWRLSLGARLEHNDYTNFVFQPNLRLLWTPTPQSSGWLSLARAVRTPSRMERGATLNVGIDTTSAAPLSILTQVVSNRLDNEVVDALDLGWRYQISRATSIDLAAFSYRYNDLRGAATTMPQLLPPGYLLVQTTENNANSARVYGMEASLDWRVSPDWRLQTHYAWLKEEIHSAALPGQTTSDYTDTAPTHQLSLRSSLDFGPNVRWDAALRHVSPIRNDNFAIPAFTALDMRLAWQARKDLELALVGQNLLDPVHLEYGSNFIRSTPMEIQRAIYVRADWKF